MCVLVRVFCRKLQAEFCRAPRYPGCLAELCNALQESEYVPEYFHSSGQETASIIHVTDYNKGWFLTYLNNKITVSGVTLNTDTIHVLALLFSLLYFTYIF